MNPERHAQLRQLDALFAGEIGPAAQRHARSSAEMNPTRMTRRFYRPRPGSPTGGLRPEAKEHGAIRGFGLQSHRRGGIYPTNAGSPRAIPRLNSTGRELTDRTFTRQATAMERSPIHRLRSLIVKDDVELPSPLERRCRAASLLDRTAIVWRSELARPRPPHPGAFKRSAA